MPLPSSTQSSDMPHLDVSEPAGLMHGVLHRGLSHTRAVGDLIDWQVAYPVALHLAGDDEKHGALALSVVVAEGIGQRARSAEHPFPVSALSPFFVRQSLTARSRRELAADPNKQSTRWVVCASAASRRPVERDGAPLINGPGQQGRFVIGERALSPIMPDGASDVIEYVGRGDGVDAVIHARRVRREGDRAHWPPPSATRPNSIARASAFPMASASTGRWFTAKVTLIVCRPLY